MTKSNLKPPPRAASLLLEPGTEHLTLAGEITTAIGTGIMPIVGTARSGKSMLALAMMEWAVQNTNRNLAFIGVPDIYIENLPAEMRKRSSNPSIGMLSSLRDSIVLLDDTAVSMNARDSSQTRNKLLNRMAGVISHLGLTILLTTQSMAGVDISLLRYVELAPMVKRIDPMALKVERDSWSEPLLEAQYALKTVGYHPKFYYSLSDEIICQSQLRPWADGNDVLSRPFRYLKQSTLDSMLAGRTPKGAKEDAAE